MEDPVKKIVEHRKHEGVYVPADREDFLFTLDVAQHDNLVFERCITVKEEKRSLKYRCWNPYKSKLAAAVVKGIENIHIKRGSHVLYLGTGFGTTLFHVADIVGPDGIVYAVENSIQRGREMIRGAERRPNILPIIQDARHPSRYPMLVTELVDVIISDLAQSDQIDILAINAKHYLKKGGHFLIFLKDYCTSENADEVVESKLEVLRKKELISNQYLTLQPYDRHHIVIRGTSQQRSTETEKKEQDCCENF